MRTRSFCDIVRDGDKIDIMRTIADSTVDTILKVDEKTFLAAVSRRRHLPPLTSTAASHAMNATSPQTTWWDSSALCLSSSIQQAARWRANRAISTACSTRPLALRGPLPTRHAGNLEPPKGRDARLAGARLALELGQQLLDDLDGVPNNLVLGSTENGGIRVLVDGDNALRPTDAGKMLDGARNTDTHEELGRNRYAGLANLMAILQPAGLHDRSRATKLGSQSLGDLRIRADSSWSQCRGPPRPKRLGIGDRGLLPHSSAKSRSRHES